MSTTRFFLFVVLFVAFNAICASASFKPLYYPFGPQTNVPMDQLVGWKRCWVSPYNSTADLLDDVFNNCTGAHLLFGCRNQTDTFTLLAVGNRTFMITDTGSDNLNILLSDNGASFYFNNITSIGFVKEGDTVNRHSCDTQPENPEYRLCWHTGRK